MTTTQETATTTRRRMIVARGDHMGVYRIAKKLNAVTDVYVYPTADNSDQVHTDMATVNLTVTPAGAWTVTTRPVWVRDQERPAPVVVAVGHVDRVPAVVRGEEGTRFAWVLDGEIQKGTVGALASWAAAERMGYADDPLPSVVYAPTTTGELVPVPVRVECSPFDADSWAYVTVTVEMGPGVNATASARVDGAA